MKDFGSDYRLYLAAAFVTFTATFAYYVNPSFQFFTVQESVPVMPAPPGPDSTIEFQEAKVEGHRVYGVVSLGGRLIEAQVNVYPAAYHSQAPFCSGTTDLDGIVRFSRNCFQADQFYKLTVSQGTAEDINWDGFTDPEKTQHLGQLVALLPGDILLSSGWHMNMLTHWLFSTIESQLPHQSYQQKYTSLRLASKAIAKSLFKSTRIPAQQFLALAPNHGVTTSNQGAQKAHISQDGISLEQSEIQYPEALKLDTSALKISEEEAILELISWDPLSPNSMNQLQPELLSELQQFQMRLLEGNKQALPIIELALNEQQIGLWSSPSHDLFIAQQSNQGSQLFWLDTSLGHDAQQIDQAQVTGKILSVIFTKHEAFIGTSAGLLKTNLTNQNLFLEPVETTTGPVKELVSVDQQLWVAVGNKVQVLDLSQSIPTLINELTFDRPVMKLTLDQQTVFVSSDELYAIQTQSPTTAIKVLPFKF